MRVHYALMDDLCSWEEFESLVEEKAPASGEGDERSAAREVVSDVGRLHICLSELRAGPSLVSFFCRVIEAGRAERFERSGGDYGFVSRILCGDETGEVILTLWDEKAFASGEISEGEILEVVGRFKRRGMVDVADLRKPENPGAINLRESGMRSFSPVSLDCIILAFAGKGVFRNTEGKESSYFRIIAGDSRGVAEIMFWNNESVNCFKAGDGIRISDAHERPSSGAKRSYSADEKSVVSSLAENKPSMPCDLFSPLPAIDAGWRGSLSVAIEDPGEVREFITRKDNLSYVRNMTVSDSNMSARLVIWGDQALMPFLKGERVDIFFSEAKERPVGPEDEETFKSFEIHAGYDSFVSLFENGGRDICIRGMVVVRNGYYSLDGEDFSHPLRITQGGIDPCRWVEIKGILYDSGRLEPKEVFVIDEDLSLLNKRIEELKRNRGC